MNLFSRKDSTMPEPVVTGVDILRRTLKARDTKAGGLKAVARDISGVSIAMLEDFANKKIDLKRELLLALARELFNAGLNEQDQLYQLNPPPVHRISIRPEPFDPTSSPHYFPHDPNASRFNLKPDKPEPAKAKGRPGWLGGF